ncbi:aminoglycoside 6-adenylyltransferase, partial [Patescibacteria group bacterium]|nr:aminoglycoside 6-adenylyltransferase [Patescibacteria group bacterium]MBU1457278.1 aminoglycoside 6-adenylyltransferase [Patescibacteria group bacterium]
EKELEPILIDTSVSHLQKIFVTNDFINLEFHISIASDFDHIDKRDLNYFPNGYSILFDKSGLLNNKIVNSIQPSQDISQQEKFDKLNNSFWFFVQSTAPFIERGEYWFAAAGYWVWMYVKLCTLLRMYSNTEVSYNPMKHIEEILNPEIITEIQPLRNLENPSDLKNKMRLLINIYSKYAKKTANLNSLTYTSKQENKVKEYVNKYLAN